eukprot:jgi/Bigna1/77698/fgenesh1_pg.49_\
MGSLCSQICTVRGFGAGESNFGFKLSKKEKKMIDDIFDYVDDDDSAIIDRDEIQSKLKDTNTPKHITASHGRKQRMQDLLDQLDNLQEDENYYITIEMWEDAFLRIKTEKGPKKFHAWLKMLFTNFTKKESIAVHQAFKLMDSDGDKIIKMEELMRAENLKLANALQIMKALEVEIENVTWVEFYYSCKQFKKNGGDILGLLRRPEIKSENAMKNFTTDEAETILEIFAFVDRNKNGVILPEEVKSTLCQEHRGRHTKEMDLLIEEFLSNVVGVLIRQDSMGDTNSDGRVDVSEWLTIFTHIKNKNKSNFPAFLNNLFTRLSPREKNKAAKVFLLLDANGDGCVTSEELKSSMQRPLQILLDEIGLEGSEVTKKQFFLCCRAYKHESPSGDLMRVLDACISANKDR